MAEALSRAEEEHEDITQTDEGASSWLQSIGLNSNQYRNLDPKKVKLYPFSGGWNLEALMQNARFFVYETISQQPARLVKKTRCEA